MLTAASNPLECNSAWAQGGIIYKGIDDSPELLQQDIHFAGAGLCKDSAVKFLASQGPECVEEILLTPPVSVPFDRTQTGTLALCLEASHNRARIIHWKDQTGLAITDCLLKAVVSTPQISLLSGKTAIDLIIDPVSASCIGARVLCAHSNTESIIYAKHVVLATGGMGEIYKHTSNQAITRGDGLAMAFRAGAHLTAMEYVQFHPTTLFLPGERAFLLTEALRGEGARLINHTGEAFAKKYHPLGELAPRDVVSRLIVSEMAATRQPNVFLDITHRDPAWLAKRFPAIHTHCLRKGYDFTQQPLPIVPAAHYLCGGVEVDLRGRTSLPGLFAAGEVACTGLHGANRLASTSLLEGLVWGRAIARDIATSSQSWNINLENSRLAERERVPETETETNSESVAASWGQLQEVMWTAVGIRRSPVALREAVQLLRGMETRAAAACEEMRTDAARWGLLNGITTG